MSGGDILKTLILSAVMMLGMAAQAYPTADFDFAVTSPRPGLVTFGDFIAAPGFPNVRGAWVQAVRWYYSTDGFAAITPDSPYIEQWLDPRDGSLPPLGIGNLPSGVRYYFKVGLATRDGGLVYFTNDYETDMARHSVVVL